MSNIKLSDLTPAVATHPGEIIHDELSARMQSEFEPGETFVQYTHRLFPGAWGFRIRQLCLGDEHTVLRANDALKLEKVLGISAEFWLNTQHNYELARVKIARAQASESL